MLRCRKARTSSSDRPERSLRSARCGARSGLEPLGRVARTELVSRSALTPRACGASLRNLEPHGGVMAGVRTSAFLAVVTMLALAAGGSAASGPQPLRGVPLLAKTALRLLVASNPPYVLDVDSGRLTPVTGIPRSRHAVVWVRPAGSDALVVLDRNQPGRKLPAQEIYVVRRGTTTAKLLGTGWGVAPSADGRAVWISAYVSARRCKLREVSLGGRQRRAGRLFPCGWLASPWDERVAAAVPLRQLDPLDGDPRVARLPHGDDRAAVGLGEEHQPPAARPRPARELE